MKNAKKLKMCLQIEEIKSRRKISGMIDIPDYSELAISF